VGVTSLDDVFYFQVEGNVNGIHLPFMVSIQTPSQMQVMFSLNDNGAISMDATFWIDDGNFIYSH
jgi:hypothetical protein